MAGKRRNGFVQTQEEGQKKTTPFQRLVGRGAVVQTPEEETPVQRPVRLRRRRQTQKTQETPQEKGQAQGEKQVSQFG